MKSFISAIVALGMALSISIALAQQAPDAAPLDPRAMVGRPAPDEGLEQAVEQIERNPAQPGSWLDFAVVLCQKGRTADSRKVLSHVESAFAPPEGIREVISLLRASSCDGPESRTRVSVALHRGYEDNVNQGSSNALFELGSAFPGVVLPLSPEFLPMGDRFSMLDASLSLARAEGVQYTVQAREKHYDRLSDFNTRLLAFGADKEWGCGVARCALSSTLGGIELGGRPYQYVAGLQLAHVGSPAHWGSTLTFEAGLTRQVFPTERSLDSWIGLAKATWKLPAPGAAQVQLSGSLGVDLPTAQRPGGRRTLGALGASGAHPLPSGYQVDWSIQEQLSQDADAYSPGLIDTARRPLLQVASLAVSKSLTPTQKLRLELRHSANHDTVSLFSYRGTALALTWQWRGDY